MRGRDGKGKGKEREENWYPHFLDESYAPALSSIVNSSLAMWSTERCYVSLDEKNETCDILVPNELKNAEHLTAQLLQ